MILAGIDIGTNTLRLLVAETGPDTIKEIYSDRTITRLGQDLDHTGKLDREARNRSLKALAGFSSSIRRYPVLRTAAIGTSALRNAENAPEFVAEVLRETGLAIEVITGRDEARLTLLGVICGLKGAAGPMRGSIDSAMVIDIGGGSTELIMTSASGIMRETSLPLGAVYLSDRFIRNDPPTIGEKQELRHAVRDVLKLQDADIRPAAGSILIGTAGTVTTLAAMDRQLATYDPFMVHRYSMTRGSIDELVRQLGSCTLEERRSLPGLEPGREDIIFAGSVITQEIMEWFGYDSLFVSDWGLREGIVLDLYKKMSVSR